MTAIKTALVSVSDKTGIVDFCRGLEKLGIHILSTGGTARLLQENGVTVTDVSEHTGFPEIMDGRVKTLHPKIHGGLLGRRGMDDRVMQEHAITPVDLVVVNLYPFEQTVSRAGCTLDEAIENIDIGGPAMLRSAAKNHKYVTAIVNTDDYAPVLAELQANDGKLGDETRFALARKVFAHTAIYDANISNYLSAMSLTGDTEMFPQTFSFQFEKSQDLRYGENPHQGAALYSESGAATGTLARARQLQGRELSYNNIADADAALECVLAFAEPACVIVKHANPCGVAVASSITEAYELAYATDPVSAFGGIIAVNRKLEKSLLEMILERQFVEVILAVEVATDALAAAADKPAIRILETGVREQPLRQLEMKRTSGGLLIQDADNGVVTAAELKVVSRRKPAPAELGDLMFAWTVVKYVKSNAIVYARNGQTIGIGAGQMSRIYSARIAAIKAADEGLEVSGSVMASDAFFPFRDAMDAAAETGIRAVIQPGGSVRDDEVIAAADEHDMAMVFTGMRHFRH